MLASLKKEDWQTILDNVDREESVDWRMFEDYEWSVGGVDKLDMYFYKNIIYMYYLVIGFWGQI